VSPTPRAGVVVLAAGAASRFGSAKQRLLVPVVLARVAESGLTEVVVVLGAHRFPVDAADVRCVEARDWARGPGASLRAGLAALPPDVEVAVVVLADGPRLHPEAIRRVLEAFAAGAGDVVAASYGGTRGHPVAIGRSLWAGLPDDGGRSLEPVLVPCDDLGDPGDVDTWEDLERLGLDADY
jgi:nicotine blue oxidoreductase